MKKALLKYLKWASCLFVFSFILHYLFDAWFWNTWNYQELKAHYSPCNVSYCYEKYRITIAAFFGLWIGAFSFFKPEK